MSLGPAGGAEQWASRCRRVLRLTADICGLSPSALTSRSHGSQTSIRRFSHQQSSPGFAGRMGPFPRLGGPP